MAVAELPQSPRPGHRRQRHRRTGHRRCAPILELLLQLFVTDSESDDVDPDVDSMLDQFADGSLRIAATGLLTTGDEDDDLRAVDPIEIDGDPLEGSADRGLHA